MKPWDFDYKVKTRFFQAYGENISDFIDDVVDLLREVNGNYSDEFTEEQIFKIVEITLHLYGQLGISDDIRGIT